MALDVFTLAIQLGYETVHLCDCCAMAELKIDIAGDSESNETYRGDPPTFGHPMHKFFFFDPTYVNLNNGEHLPTPLPWSAFQYAYIQSGLSRTLESV